MAPQRYDADTNILIDTLDLQDQNAPSAKDHTTQNVNPAPHDGGMAPHQELSIRHADQDTRAEIMHGPTGEIDGYGDGIDMYDDEDPDERHHDLGGASEDGDLTDGEGDDLMDDDMMDKISSSPSIDDGAFGSTLFSRLPWAVICARIVPCQESCSNSGSRDLRVVSRGYRFRICICAS